MLQNLANYLLGGTSTNSDTTTTNAQLAAGVENNQPNSSSSTRVALITTDHDDGWTLVDRDSEGNSETSSVYSEEEDEEVGDLREVPVTRTSSVDSLRGAGGMEESWFVTPPPSFTSSGPIHMETSPLENLLIEHPSMSVYQHTGGRRPHFQYLRSSSPPEGAVEEEHQLEEDEEEVQGGEPIVVVHRVLGAPPRCNRVQALQLHDAQLAKSRRAQKVQIKKSAQQAARGYLNRTNKAREANGRGWNPRRKERCQGSTRSNANNNRKCC